MRNSVLTAMSALAVVAGCAQPPAAAPMPRNSEATTERPAPPATPVPAAGGIYLTPAKAYRLWQADPARVHILDVRTPAEFLFAGRPTMAVEAMQALARAAQSGPKLGDDLSQREREVLALLAAGNSNPEIAEQLVISLPTVKSHVSHILDKLGVANRAEAASVAVKHNLIPR